MWVNLTPRVKPYREFINLCERVKLSSTTRFKILREYLLWVMNLLASSGFAKVKKFELKRTRMFLLVAGLVLVVGGGGADMGEVDSCDSAQLKECVALIPRTQYVGLPRTKEELDAHCQAFQTGMSCMDKWIKRCLPTDGQKVLQQQIGGARAIMQFLCTNETALRKEFLREPMCWSRVSPEWTQCVDQLQDAVREIRDRAQQLTYFDRNAELCCARDAFMMCVTEAGRTCTAAASTLLKRMAWVLAQDVAACTQHPRAYCSAPTPPRAAPILTALFGIVFYPPNF